MNLLEKLRHHVRVRREEGGQGGDPRADLCAVDGDGLTPAVDVMQRVEAVLLLEEDLTPVVPDISLVHSDRNQLT